MNITSKRLDKIKKTKNQSRRRIHYKNKKKNGKEKNRRNNRKYNKSTGKYRKTHKRKKRAYDLKNKSLKFKENQPINKSATLKIITTDKPVETLKTGGGLRLWETFKKVLESANTKKQNKIKQLEDEIFAIISVNKENDNVRDFYEWYIDELLKIAFKTNVDDMKYEHKHDYYNRKLRDEAFGKAIKGLQVNNKADKLYNENNKGYLIDIFKHTLTDAKKHLKVLFDGTAEKTGQVVPIENAILENGKKIKYTNPDETINIYDFTHLTLKMDEILKAAKKAAAEKKAEEEREAAAKKKEEEEEEKEKKEREAAAKKKEEEEEEKEKKEREAAAAKTETTAEEGNKEATSEAAENETTVETAENETEAAAKKKTEEDKNMKTEEEINNIKTNIKTPEFNDFLEKVKKENGPYSDFLEANQGNPFKNLIDNSKVMTGGADDEGKKGTEKGAEEGEQQTNDDDNLVKIYDYLMNKDNQDKIRKYLTEKENTTELENFDAMIEGIKYAKFAEARYALPEHISNIMLLKPGVAGADTAVMSTDTSDLKTTDALVDLGNFKKHVTATQDVVDDDQSLQSGGYREIYNMMRQYYNDKTANQWNEENWFKLGEKFATLINNKSDKENFLNDLTNGDYGEAQLVADAMRKVLKNIDGENEMRVGMAYANKDNLDSKITEAKSGVDEFVLKAIIRGTDEFNCDDGPKQRNGSRLVGHYDSFVKIDGNDMFVHFDAIKKGTLKSDEDIPEIVNIKDYLPNDSSCNYLIFLFNKDKEYPTTENLEDLKVATSGNGKNRCWINATLYAVLFGIMNKEKNKLSIVDDERVKKEAENLQKRAKENLKNKDPNEVAENAKMDVEKQFERMKQIKKQK